MSATKEWQCPPDGLIPELQYPSSTFGKLKKSAIRSVEHGLPIEKGFLYSNTASFGEVENVSYQMSDDITILKQFGV